MDEGIHYTSLCDHCLLGGLKGDVQVLSGQVKGKTLLPMSPQAEMATMAVSLDDG